MWDTKNDTVLEKTIWFAKSTDHGATWAGQVQVDDGSPDGVVCNDPTSAVTPAGVLYIVCQRGTGLDLFRSDDGGSSFDDVSEEYSPELDLTDDVSTLRTSCTRATPSTRARSTPRTPRWGTWC